MRPRLRALAARQSGLFTRQQAIEVGYTPGEIRRNTRPDGPWTVVRRGVYVERQVAEAATRWEERMLLRDRAAHLHLTRPHLMSHDSAARILRLPVLRTRPALVHVTRFGVGGSRTEDGVKHHLTRVGLLDAPVVDGVRVTGLARTALDIAREHGFEHGTAACDSALQLGVERDDFKSQLELMWSWPGVTRARAAARASDVGGESLGETLTRLVVQELGYEDVETQFPVLVGATTYRADLRVGRRLIEFDGHRKYLRGEDGGVAPDDVARVVWREKRRQDALCAQQLGMSRVVWDELFGPARGTLRLLLRHEIEATARLFGAELPPAMVELAARQRPRRLARSGRPM